MAKRSLPLGKAMKAFLTVAPHPTARSRKTLTIALVFAAISLVSSCSGADQYKNNGDGELEAVSPNSAPESTTGFKRVVQLATADWTAAQATTEIAEKLIERRLGYPVTQVEVVDLRELVDQLRVGDVDAVLEVWPATLDQPELDTIEAGRVERLGDLGVETKIGWYVPRYVVEANPDLATWEGFLDPSAAANFATAETGRDGRFLGTDPGYLTVDEELIEALRLPFVVEYSGSEQATRSALRSAVAGEEPIVVYWWTPTPEITQFDLVNVTLPERTDACVEDFETGKLMACDYPEESLVKLGYPGLAEQDPDLHRFLMNFTLTTEDQLALTYEIDILGRSLDEVTTEWIDLNQDRWEPWLLSE